MKLTTAERQQKKLYKEAEELKFKQILAANKKFNLPYGLNSSEQKFCETLIKKSKKLQKFFGEPSTSIRSPTCSSHFIHKVVQNFPNWKRSSLDWEPKTYSVESQLIDICQHIFGQYKVPEFLASVWLETDFENFIPWYLAVAQGKSLKTISPFSSMTARMRHIFLTTPSKYNVVEAVYRAGAIALGADKILVQTVLTSRLTKQLNRYEPQEHFSFWITLIQFFINNPMLALSQFDPLIDYIQHMREQPLRINGQMFGWRHPSHPGFKIIGRSPLKLLEDMNLWHRETQKLKHNGFVTWPSCGLEKFVHIEGPEYHQKIWEIEEILNSKALHLEGRDMHHCVGSYTRDCKSGYNSIWSMKCQETKVLTVQVAHTSSYPKIIQARGLQNRYPTQKEKQILNVWAQQKGIQF